MKIKYSWFLVLGSSFEDKPLLLFFSRYWISASLVRIHPQTLFEERYF